ncbi:hypothetical protein psal_cds_1380 [Pandoravirus salinus]|uniref:Uncharacterized protein n=1 Tax=Pandoravirus salinus TaxID=1349410 RepID=S4W4X7_9VIRU|nr:Atrophin-1 superfamily incomplete domain [Pandoravirus salinus]AGO85787.1 hypothetical protein psal_cds_1380 [Pandoravirus salinus]
MSTLPQRRANPFAAVLSRSSSAPACKLPQPTAAQPAAAPTPEPTGDTRAATERWRNYGAASAAPAAAVVSAPPAGAAAPLSAAPVDAASTPSAASAPTAATAAVPAASAVQPRLSRTPFRASRRIAARGPSPQTSAVPLAAAPSPATMHPQETPRSQQLPHQPFAEPVPSPLAAVAPTTCIGSAPADPAAALPLAPATSAGPSVAVQSATSPSVAEMPLAPSGPSDALSAALADAAHQRALIARLVAVVAAGCPSCCAKVVSVLTDGAPASTQPTLPYATTTAAAGPPPQHIHVHLPTGDTSACKRPLRAVHIRRKALGVLAKHRCK